MAYKLKVKALMTPKISFNGAAPEAARRFAHWVVDDVDPYVPYRTGRLSGSVSVRDNRLMYDTPYAHKLYFVGTAEYEAEHPEKKFDPNRRKFHFSLAVHPRAQSFWFWGRQQDNFDEWCRKAQEFMYEAMFERHA